jgi:uncharacterized protein (TIGR02466 family)
LGAEDSIAMSLEILMNGSLFESSELLSLFSTPVWELQLPARRYEPINAAVLAVLEEARAGDSPPAPGTAWQSRPDLQLRPELSGLVDCIHEATKRILSFLKIAHRGIRITGCWANVNALGTAHGIHSHPNNYLSGVYYVRTPDGADSINLHDPRVQTGIIRPPVTALTAQNTDMVVIRVQAGHLLVFPSWLQHSVTASTAESERVSVSFNVMFTDYTQAMSSPLW